MKSAEFRKQPTTRMLLRTAVVTDLQRYFFDVILDQQRTLDHSGRDFGSVAFAQKHANHMLVSLASLSEATVPVIEIRDQHGVLLARQELVGDLVAIETTDARAFEMSDDRLRNLRLLLKTRAKMDVEQPSAAAFESRQLRSMYAEQVALRLKRIAKG